MYSCFMIIDNHW